MSLGKELLLSCIVMMHISFMASRAAGLGRVQMKEIELSLCNLQQTEKDYIKHIFNGNPPMNYNSRNSSLKHIKGITLPVGNTREEIQASVCAISDYLDNHLPAIIGNLTQQHQDIIKNIDEFHYQFKGAVQLMDGSQHTQHCHRNVTTSGDYNMKVIGLRIIYFSRQWVESFIGAQSSCNS